MAKTSGWIEHGYGTRFQGFQNLMRDRIRDILLVSSLYDLYLFEEDGRLYELIRNEYQGLQLSHAPELTRVSNGHEALSLLNDEKKFDLIITTLHIEDVHPVNFAKMIRKTGMDIPIVLLSFDNRELNDLLLHSDITVFNKIFIWQGDFRLIIGIIKYLEDRLNVEQDTSIVGVQSIIVIEDNIKYYSSFLPLIYTELIQQSKRLISEGINLTHRYLRMRARPKILLCSTYEEAMDYFNKYEEHILGIISDIDFIRGGNVEPRAGLDFCKEVKSRHSDIPVLLQSTSPDYEIEAYELGASFLLKGSPTLMNDLRHFMIQYFSFGDFVFKIPGGNEIANASNLIELEEQLKLVPGESIKYHAERNHFSNWFKARTEFWLADKVRPQKVTDYQSIDDLRKYLLKALNEYRKLRQRGIITDFKKESFDPGSSFARIGGGSLGGKARGLGFLNILINNYGLRDQFERTKIVVPPGIVIGTDIFDQFLDDNNLRSFALNCEDDDEIKKRFLEAERFPEDCVADLISFLDVIKEPLAVRSSSLLEDSQYHPFAGVYATYMIPNNNNDPFARLRELVNTIKLVYASTFSKDAKDYIKMTSYRLEEEKMAVIIQKMVGTTHKTKFYPDISGVAKSYNFYPLSPMEPTDGIVSVGLGLGKLIVEGGVCLKFCPKYPNNLIQFYSTKETLNSQQKYFYALDLEAEKGEEIPDEDMFTKQFDMREAEKDGTLHYVGSTYSAENDAIYDGLSRAGIRVVTFAPILKHKIFPLPQILELLLDMGTWGMGTPVEIEFAVNMSVPPKEKREFGVLQMRPLVIGQELGELNLNEIAQEKVVCKSESVLGTGTINDILDIVYVDHNTFERSRSRDVAQEVSYFNSKLVNEKKPYLLIGVGRWGTLDPWLGIPITWPQIAGAKCIIESDLKDISVQPSQGSHFFQNITSFMIGYFTVGKVNENSYIDWEWLNSLPAEEEKEFTRHITLEKPLTIKMNARQNAGVILKPGVEDQSHEWNQ